MDEYVGMIIQFAGDLIPRHYLACDGSVVSTKEFGMLYSVMAESVSETITLPDLRPIDADGQRRDWRKDEVRSIICVSGHWPERPQSGRFS